MSDSSNSGGYRNRIIERIYVRAGDILPNLRNPKSHGREQIRTLDAIFSRFGIVDALIAYRSARNGGALTYFDGHGRNMTDPTQVWPVDVTDLSDEEVDQLVLYFDEVGSMAKPDTEVLADLLRQANLDDDSLAALAALVAKEARIDIAGLIGIPEDDDLTGLLPAPAAEYTEAPDAGLPAEGMGSGAPLPLADIKLLQLYFTTAQRETFLVMVEALAVKFGTNSTTDSVMEAVRYAHTNLAATD